MAGARLDVELNSQAAQDALNRLLEVVGDIKPTLLNIAEYLHISHRQRFESQSAPDGTPWAALSPSYQKIKKSNKDKILVLSDNLNKTLRHQIGDNELLFGSNLPYASFHQFGTRPYVIKPKNKKALAFGGVVVKKVNHPGLEPRPFLGTSEADNVEILNILINRLERS